MTDDKLRAALRANGWFVATVDDARWVESSEWVPVIRAALAASATDEGPRDPDQNVWDAIGDPEQPLTRVHEKQAPVVLSKVGGVELVAVSVDRAGLVRWEERPTRVADDALIAELASDLCPDKEPCKGHRIRAREYLAARPAVPALDVERTRIVFHDEYERDYEHGGCGHANQHRKTWDCWRRTEEFAREYAALRSKEPTDTAQLDWRDSR